jgi:predicted alpha/beta hydrolase
MAKARNTKPAVDPIFAAIEAHRRMTAVRYPILEAMGNIEDGLPERWALEDAHDKFANVEKAATVKLRKSSRRPSQA